MEKICGNCRFSSPATEAEVRVDTDMIVNMVNPYATQEERDEVFRDHLLTYPLNTLILCNHPASRLTASGIRSSDMPCNIILELGKVGFEEKSAT